MSVDSVLKHLGSRPNDVDAQRELATTEGPIWRIRDMFMWDPEPANLEYPHLHELEMVRAQAADRFLRALQAPNLRRLSLCLHRQRWDAVAALVDADQLRLEELTLMGPVDSDAFATLAHNGLPQLRKLVVRSQEIDEPLARAIAAWPALEELELERCGLRAGTMKALATIPGLRKLCVSGASAADLGNAQVRALANLQGTLRLSGCGLTPARIALLAGSPISHLDLRHNDKLTSECVETLRSMPNLEEVRLGGTLLRHHEVEPLLAAGIRVLDRDDLERLDDGVLHLDIFMNIAMFSWSPLLDRVRSGDLTLTDLVQADDMDSPTHLLHLVARYGSLPAVKSLLKQGADLNQVDPLGRTPLMMAASGRNAASQEQGYASIVKRLLDLGAVVSTEDSDGRAALHHAASVGGTKCVKLLIKAGAQEHEDNAGQTAAQICAAEADPCWQPKCLAALRKAPVRP